jgi:prophage tail gpP-like protein
MNEQSEQVVLVVDGKRYAGWKSVRVTRSIESLAGSFALEVSDRWDGAKAPWPIAVEDPCLVVIDGQLVIAGYVDKRGLSADAESRTLSYSGRDAAAALVDCSALPPRWTFHNVTLADFASTLAKPFGVRVLVQPGAGIELKKRAKIVVQPGDTAYEAIARAAAEEEVLLASDGAGAIVITRAGAQRAAPLVEGQNILSASVDYDGVGRFHRYVLSTQAAGTDTASGNASRVRGEATDEGVRRTERVRLVLPGQGHGGADAAKKRADWEARIRAAKTEAVTVTVQGWMQPDGWLWPLNALTHVQAPRLIGVDGDMLIAQVEHTIGDSGRLTQLHLVRPDAFTPEPKAVVKKAGAMRGWPELAKGGLPEAEKRFRLEMLLSYKRAIIPAFSAELNAIRDVKNTIKKLIP